jgi:hypothetical protein
MAALKLKVFPGCPTEGRIMGPLVRDRSNPRSLVANFDAFKFPTSEVFKKFYYIYYDIKNKHDFFLSI